MVPAKFFTLKKQQAKYHKNRQCNGFLYRFKLNQGVRPPIAFKPRLVCRYLKHILEESQAPTDEDDGKQTHAFAPTVFLKFKVPVPGKRHKSIGYNEENDGFESAHTADIN